MTKHILQNGGRHDGDESHQIPIHKTSPNIRNDSVIKSAPSQWVESLNYVAASLSEGTPICKP